MKNFLSFLQSHVNQGVESTIVRHIANEIVNKNRRADFMELGKMTMEYLAQIAKTDFSQEVKETPFATTALDRPHSLLGCAVWNHFTSNDSMKMQALKALTGYVNEFEANLQYH